MWRRVCVAPLRSAVGKPHASASASAAAALRARVAPFPASSSLPSRMTAHLFSSGSPSSFLSPHSQGDPLFPLDFYFISPPRVHELAVYCSFSSHSLFRWWIVEKECGGRDADRHRTRAGGA